MNHLNDGLQSRNGWPPDWRPQPGEALTGVIERYAIGRTPSGRVWGVVVSREPTGEPVSLWLTSTSLLSLFAQHQPQRGERIDVHYRWRAPDHGYQRWRLIVDRPVGLDFSPLGGEMSDEAPWHRGRSLAPKHLAPAPPSPYDARSKIIRALVTTVRFVMAAGYVLLPWTRAP